MATPAERKKGELRTLLAGILGSLATGDVVADFMRYNALRMLRTQGVREDFLGVTIPKIGGEVDQQVNALVSGALNSQEEQVARDFRGHADFDSFMSDMTSAAEARAKAEGVRDSTENLARNGPSPTTASPASPASPNDPSATQHDSIPGTVGVGSSATTTPSQPLKEPADGTPTGTPTPAPVGSASAGATTGTGGGGGGGSVAATPAATSGAGLASAEAGTPVQIPDADNAQVWLVDGIHYIVAWDVPGTQTNLFYHVDNPEYLDAIFRGAAPEPTVPPFDTGGAENPFEFLEQQGEGHYGGKVSEIQNTSENPWGQAAEAWNEKSKVVPWMNDPDVLAWLAEGIIEGNPQALTPQIAKEQGFAFAEGKGTAELTRSLEIFGMTTEEIDRERSLIRSTVEGYFRTYGVTIDDTSRAAVEVTIDNMFRGEWDVATATNEIKLFADPVTRDRSALVDAIAEGGTITSLRQDVANVRDEVEQWVGPAVAKLLGDRWYESWAEQLRNDPNAQVKLDEALLGLRVANFGAFGDNPGLRYDDMAASMRGLGQQMWGSQLDETDPFFLSLVQQNDLNAATQTLRKEGLDRNITQVNQTAAKQMQQAFGSGVLNSLEV